MLSGLTISLKSQTLETLTDTNVIFHDYIPDIIVTNPYTDTLKIDLNQDGVLDVQFYIHYYPAPIPYVLTLSSNCHLGFFKYINTSDSLLNSAIVWLSGDVYWNDDYYQNKLGVRLTVGTDHYYGWVAVTYTRQPPKYVIDKYAFCKIANYPFLYGQTEISTGIPKNSASDEANIRISDSGNIVSIESIKQINSITITNTNGINVVSRNKIRSNNVEISISDLTKGMYIIQVQFTDSKIFTKQIVK